jgi:hypothetical protein
LRIDRAKRLGGAKIQLSVQRIEKYSCQAVAISFRPLQAAPAAVSTLVDRRINRAITKR